MTQQNIVLVNIGNDEWQLWKVLNIDDQNSSDSSTLNDRTQKYAMQNLWKIFIFIDLIIRTQTSFSFEKRQSVYDDNTDDNQDYSDSIENHVQ